MINNVLKAKQQEYGEVFREVRFPLLVSNIINSAPGSRIDAVFFTIMAVLSVYSTRLRLSYFYDSYLSGCQLQVFVIGDQSCGKGSIDNIQSRLIEKLLVRDERSRKLEEAYKEQIRHLSDKAKSKITPPSVCVLVLPPSTSRHKICVRASEIHKVYNDTLFFYMSTPELGTVLDANRLAFSDLRTISRLSYDLGAIYGQEHGGADGFTGLVNINVSFLLLGTAHALHRYFNSSALLDGNISRSIIVNIPTEIGENPPYFKPLSDVDNATIDTVLDKLINNIFDDENNVLKDTVQPDLGFLYHHVNNFQEVAAAEAVKTRSKAIDTFRKRSSVSAFRIAAICFNLYNISNELLPEGQRFSTADIEAATVAIYNYCAFFILNSILDFCGNRYDSLQEQIEVEAKKENKQTLYDFMPDFFSKAELDAAIESEAINTPVRVFISKWIKQGRLEDLGDNTYRKIKK